MKIPPPPPETPMTTPALLFDAVSKNYDGRQALNALSWELGRGEILCLLGPSGCGKTTTLMIAAGLLREDSGRVFLRGREVSGPKNFTPPEKRGIGFVFQDYALFPHMTALDNAAFGVSGGRAAGRAAAQETLKTLNLDDKAHLYPHDLSGGEKQRVALARAIAPSPRIILMDEPFSNLDRHLRERLREKTRAILREKGASCLFVTHSSEEAMWMGDRILLMREGRIVQQGKPQELFDKPADISAARLFGEINLVSAAICRNGGGLEARSASLAVSATALTATAFRDGDKALLAIRPEAFSLVSEGGGGGGDGALSLKGRVLEARPMGGEAILALAAEGFPMPLKARIRNRALPRVGEKVQMRLSPDMMFLFPETPQEE